MDDYRQLSDTQQIVLSVLPIPSAIISILGSTAIIYLARQRRKVQQCTPYTRLLVAMSVCDIAFSISTGVATFLRPRETSRKIWAFGNDATCSFGGFMVQATTGGIWYQGMLSIYFLLTTRYGMKNATIAKRIEPLMHITALGFPIGTAIVGTVMGIYGERAGRASCYVRSYDSSSAPDARDVKEEKGTIDAVIYFFFAIPVLVVFICLVTNNIAIYLFVRRHTGKLASKRQVSTPIHVNASFGWSKRTSNHVTDAIISRISKKGKYHKKNTQPRK